MYGDSEKWQCEFQYKAFPYFKTKKVLNVFAMYDAYQARKDGLEHLEIGKLEGAEKDWLRVRMEQNLNALKAI